MQELEFKLEEASVERKKILEETSKIRGAPSAFGNTGERKSHSSHLPNGKRESVCFVE